MSWSVNESGKIADVRRKLSEQFKGPLEPTGLADDGERKTVEMIQDLIDQCLSTFGVDKNVNVSAFGHMGFVKVSIEPTS
jgi:hypothetical protein